MQTKITVMFRFKPASQFIERDHSAVRCALSTEHFILNNFGRFSK
jgi:hypothetical protein